MVGFGRSSITIFLWLGSSLALGPQTCLDIVPSIHAGEQPHHIRKEAIPAAAAAIAALLLLLLLLAHHHTPLP